MQDRIEAARQRGGRAESVTLVAVTKGCSPGIIREALEAGVSDIGENRVQEAKAKWAELASAFAEAGIRRHMIGHLQRNKAAVALELFDVVQSVDSLRLARKISDLAAAAGRRVPVLIQVNAGNEESKFGFAPEEVEAVVPQLVDLPGLDPAGLMTLAPLRAGEARLRAIFGGMRKRFESLRATFPDLGFRHLSMGMSGDFELAIEEGATMVRIGTALFAAPAAGAEATLLPGRSRWS